MISEPKPNDGISKVSDRPGDDHLVCITTRSVDWLLHVSCAKAIPPKPPRWIQHPTESFCHPGVPLQRIHPVSHPGSGSACKLYVP